MGVLEQQAVGLWRRKALQVTGLLDGAGTQLRVKADGDFPLRRLALATRIGHQAVVGADERHPGADLVASSQQRAGYLQCSQDLTGQHHGVALVPGLQGDGPGLVAPRTPVDLLNPLEDRGDGELSCQLPAAGLQRGGNRRLLVAL
ncbi:hypothetical protein D9M69_611600 [compost metagenome]